MIVQCVIGLALAVSPMEALGPPPEVVALARHVLLRAREAAWTLPEDDIGKRSAKDDALGRVAKAQAVAGFLEDALRTAEGVRYGDRQLKMECELDAAIAQAHRGEVEAASVTVRRAEEDLVSLRSSGQADRHREVEHLGRLSIAHALLGNWSAAESSRQQMLRAMDRTQLKERWMDESWKLGIRTSIAVKWSASGNLRRGLELLDEIPDEFHGKKPQTIALALGQIAAIRARAGDVKGAQGLAGRIHDASDRASTLLEIARIQLDAGEKKEAVVSTLDLASLAAEAIKADYKRLGLAYDFARFELKRGDGPAARAALDLAIEILAQAQLITGPNLAAAGAIQAQMGLKAESRETLRHAAHLADANPEGGHHRKWELAQVARSYVDAGEIEEALVIVEKLDGSGDFVLDRIAIRRAESGDMDDASRRVAAIKSESRRIETAEQIAFLKAKAGDFRVALKWSDEQPSPRAKTRALLGTARGLLECGGMAEKPKTP